MPIRAHTATSSDHSKPFYLLFRDKQFGQYDQLTEALDAGLILLACSELPYLQVNNAHGQLIGSINRNVLSNQVFGMLY